VTEHGGPPDDLGRRVVKGARWVIIVRFASMATLWIVSIALAHLLDRSQYGLAGMANIFITLLIVFQDSGLHAALIHRRDRIEEAIDAAVVYAAVSCACLALVCLFAAPLVGWFFHNHEVTSLVRGLSLVFVFRGVSQVPQAILQRELHFGRYAAVMLTGNVILGATAITLAVAGAGAWSPLVGAMALEAWCAVLMWPLSGIHPRPRRASYRMLRELLTYGRGLVGANVSNIVYSYVDNAVIGRNLGPASLGAYSIGYAAGKQPTTTLALASTQLVFPAYAHLQDDRLRLRRAYLRSLRFLAVVSMPIGCALAAVSTTFVHVIYGKRWHEAAPVLAIMAVTGLVLSVTAPMGEVMKALNRPGQLFRLAALEAVVAVVAVLLLYPHGIAAVAAGNGDTVTVDGALATRITGRLLDISPRDWAATLLPAAAAGSVLAATLVGAEALLVGVAPAVRLAIEAVAVVPVYLLALRVIAHAQLREFLGELDRLGAVSTLRARLGRALRPT
jgi:O-antigen/teichoic acid export membrane protein